MDITAADLASLADKLAALDLTDTEAAILDAVFLRAEAGLSDDEVAGFARLGRPITADRLGGILSGAGLYSADQTTMEVRSTQRPGQRLGGDDQFP